MPVSELSTDVRHETGGSRQDSQPRCAGPSHAHLAASLALQHTLQAAPQVAQQLGRQLGLQLCQRMRAATGRQRQQQLQQRGAAAVVAQAVQRHTCRVGSQRQLFLSKLCSQRLCDLHNAARLMINDSPAHLQRYPGPARQRAPACVQAAAGCLAARQSAGGVCECIFSHELRGAVGLAELMLWHGLLSEARPLVQTPALGSTEAVQAAQDPPARSAAGPRLRVDRLGQTGGAYSSELRQ